MRAVPTVRGERHGRGGAEEERRRGDEGGGVPIAVAGGHGLVLAWDFGRGLFEVSESELGRVRCGGEGSCL
jgi:hypothetical protein